MKVLVCHRDLGSRKLVSILASQIPEMEFLDCLPGQPIEPLTGADTLIAIGQAGRETIEAGTFGLIQTVGTGYDNVDVEAATEAGVWVANMPAGKTGNAESVAEHAILLMLALARRLTDAQQALREGRWAQPVGTALCGKRVCLVGLGDVGTALAERLHAFGMKIAATRRDPSKSGPAYVSVLRADALGEAVSEADFIVLCARAGGENRGLIDAAILSKCKPGAILINVARGSLIDHAALVDALRGGRIRAAGLDVFEPEPADLADPLFARGNVLATPHIAGVTDLNMGNTMRLVAANLRRYARGETPEFLVNHPLHPRASTVIRYTQG